MALLFELKQKLSQGFSGFWARYPIRKARKDAIKAWEERVTPEIEEEIHKALDWQIPEWEAMDWYTPPLPATYIRKERYTDQPSKPKSPMPSRPTANVRPQTTEQITQTVAVSKIQSLIRNGLSPEEAKFTVYRELGWIKGDPS